MSDSISRTGATLIPVFLCMLMLTGCPKKDPGAKTKAKATQATQLKTVQDLLGMVPADAEAVGIILNWKQTYQLLGSMQNSLDHHPFGKVVLGMIRKQRLASPIPLPWTEKELATFGLDPAGPMAIFGRAKPIMVFSVKDGATLKKSLATVWSKGTGKWASHMEGGLELHTLSGPRKVFCLFMGRRMICSPDKAALLEAHNSKPKRSFLSGLTEAERKYLAKATLVFSARGKQLSGLGSLHATSDGGTIRLKLSGAGLRRLTAMMGSKGAPTLPGLMGDARTVVYSRMHLRALFGLLGSLIPNPRHMGLDPLKLQASLTGEVLVLEQSRDEMAVVVGCRQRVVSQTIVEALIKSLKASQKPGAPPLKIEAVSRGDQGTAYRLPLPGKVRGVPVNTVMGLAASPAGVVFGSWKTVEALWTRTPAAEAQWKKTLSPDEQEAFTSKTILAVRSPLGDPLAHMSDLVDKLLRAGAAPPQVGEGMQLARFFLDQMYSNTLGLTEEGEDQLKLVLQLRTLHQDGAPKNDSARKLMLQGLEAKYQGKTKEYEDALGVLAKQYAGTRYGKVLENKEPGLLGKLFTGILAAVAVPAFLKYHQRNQQAEAYENLSKMAMGARVAYLASGATKKGKHSFPATVAWTPAAPCCKTAGGSCVPGNKTWTNPTWATLRFKLSVPHRFQYRFVNKGKSFSAEARVDPACNGTFTLLRMEGKLTDDGSVAISPLKSK